MKKIYFAAGSQDLYGEATLRQVAVDSQKIATFLSDRLKGLVMVVHKNVVTQATEAKKLCQEASYDDECVGIILWMHTFSPAKMWIKGLQLLSKPLLHLHTQANEKLPYDAIDMDFMNLNQSAHGDREFGFVLRRLNIPHQIAVGYYEHENVVRSIRQFAEVSLAIDFSKNLKVATFGNNMRDVAVTDGDRVESQIRYGWEANYYALGDLVELIQQVTPREVDHKMAEYELKYRMNTTQLDAVREQAKYDVALHRFIEQTGVSAISDTFQDLYGLRQLPGLAIQNIMAEGVGFGPEGDYKTACLDAVLMKMAAHRPGVTGFMEDYTYDLSENQELELGSHMLEVSPTLASETPKIEVHPLNIGGKEDPARLVFKGVEGKGIQVTMIDLGTHFRLIAMEIELVEPQATPKLPVARLMWKILPTFEQGVRFWLENGGGHHAVISTALTLDDIILFAKLTNTEICYLKS